MGRSGIEELFSNRTLTELLVVFMLHPEEEYHQRQLTGLIGKALMPIQRNLQKLERIGLISSRADGNRQAYRVNRMSPIFEEVRQIILKTKGLGDLLRGKLEQLGAEIDVAFIYGSVAGGTDAVDSDIDLMIIGDVSTRAAAKVVAEIKKVVNREVNLSVYRRDEFRERVLEGNHFAIRLIDTEKIYIVGDDEALSSIYQK